jgi:hypothetical protein
MLDPSFRRIPSKKKRPEAPNTGVQPDVVVFTNCSPHDFVQRAEFCNLLGQGCQAFSASFIAATPHLAGSGAK